MSSSTASISLRQSEAVWRSVEELKPNPDNPRTHSRKQLKQLASSIRRLRVMTPIAVDESGMVLCGHARLAAAQELAMKRVPCIVVEGLTPQEKAALVIADNKIASNADWDPVLLPAGLKLATSVDISFEDLGWDPAEVDLLFEGQMLAEEPGDPRDDRLPALAPNATVSQLGDLFELGPHRLLCGDATSADAFAALMGEEKAEAVITDPPYNVPIAGHVRGRRSKHAEFKMASGEMSPEQFTNFLKRSFELLVRHSIDGALHFIFMDWRHLREILAAGDAAYTEQKNLCVWVKDNGGMGTFYRSRHELVLVFKSGTAPHLNNFELGQHGRYRTNVWQYKGVNTRKQGRAEELDLHPTVKPVAMVADAIKDVSRHGGLVLDAFGGSGTTLIAAHKTGRRARLLELAPIYVDRIVRRWERFAKDDAMHVTSGLSFSDLAKRRDREA